VRRWVSHLDNDLCVELIQKMAHSSSEAEYNSLYAQFQCDAPTEMVIYFNANWNPIKSEWVLGLKFGGGSFLNSTNNRLRSIIWKAEAGY